MFPRKFLGQCPDQQWRNCIFLGIIITSHYVTECDGCKVQQAVFIIHCKFEANILMTMLEDLT